MWGRGLGREGFKFRDGGFVKGYFEVSKKEVGFSIWGSLASGVRFGGSNVVFLRL